MEKIEQRHRVRAAEMIPGSCAKSEKVRQKILAGEADDHPTVQAVAFYENKGN